MAPSDQSVRRDALMQLGVLPFSRTSRPAAAGCHHLHLDTGQGANWAAGSASFPASRFLHHRRLGRSGRRRWRTGAPCGMSLSRPSQLTKWARGDRLRHRKEPAMMLTDKVAVIYGAGGAIGGAVARGFAAEGPAFSPGGTGHRSKRWPRTSCPPTAPPRWPRSTSLTSRLWSGICGTSSVRRAASTSRSTRSASRVRKSWGCRRSSWMPRHSPCRSRRTVALRPNGIAETSTMRELFEIALGHRV